MGSRSGRLQPTLALGVTGLGIGGGVAAVSELIIRTTDDLVRQNHLEAVHHLVLHHATPRLSRDPSLGRVYAAGGSKPVFAMNLLRSRAMHRPRLTLFDHLGIARVGLLARHLPPARGQYAVYVHGLELDRLPHQLTAMVLTRASCLIANSTVTAERLTALLPSVRPLVRIITPAISPDRQAQWSHGASKAPPLSARENQILIVGRMWASQPGKGHDSLLEALPLIPAGLDVRLVIVGTGDDRPRLESKARHLAVDHMVDFRGDVSVDELGDEYNAAKVYAMPSAQEGFGIVYAEAMWHGLPCIGSTRDAARAVISDGHNGLLVPYGDPAVLAQQLTQLLQDDTRLTRMGAAAKKTADTEYSFSRFEERMGRTITNLLKAQCRD